jgi:outer membrane biosynthesis protein TonB
VKIGTDGRITEAVVLEGKGHPMLRRSLERIMDGLAGRHSGLTLPAPVELPFDFEFKLN